MTDQKIMAVLNKIRDDGDLSYKNAVPKLTENMLLSEYGASILGNPYVKNAFLNAFMNFFIYEETKQHIFESEFDRLKSPINVNRYGSFEAFRNTVKPMSYDDTDLARILRVYKPDVKTAYFARNRQDVFPMSVALSELEVAFTDYRSFDSFVSGLYEQLVNSNKVVEYNAIKECINVNVQGGAIKTVTIPTIDSTTAPAIAKMIRSYVTKMGKPSTKYNAYIDMDGAEGEPVETQTPKKSLVLIANADTIAELSIDVLASAFNLAYADFEINLIELDDFGYNIYDRQTRTIAGRHNSKIQFMICDEALFKIEDNLDATFQGTNDAAMVKQTFYHIWQTIQVRPWANAVAFCYEDGADISVSSQFVENGAPVTVFYKPTSATIDTSTTLKSSKGNTIPTSQPADLKAESEVLAEISYKIEEAIKSITKTTDKKDGTITVERTSNDDIKAGTYNAGENDELVISQKEYNTFVTNYGDTSKIDIAFFDQDHSTYSTSVFVNMKGK